MGGVPWTLSRRTVMGLPVGNMDYIASGSRDEDFREPDRWARLLSPLRRLTPEICHDLRPTSHQYRHQLLTPQYKLDCTYRS